VSASTPMTAASGPTTSSTARDCRPIWWPAWQESGPRFEYCPSVANTSNSRPQRPVAGRHGLTGNRPTHRRRRRLAVLEVAANRHRRRTPLCVNDVGMQWWRLSSPAGLKASNSSTQPRSNTSKQ
jgi:hypothetical protein